MNFQQGRTGVCGDANQETGRTATKKTAESKVALLRLAHQISVN